MTYEQALQTLRDNRGTLGSCIWEDANTDEWYIGYMSEAEKSCRYHFVECRDGMTRIWERSYRDPEATEWKVKPWVSLDEQIEIARYKREGMVAG